MFNFFKTKKTQVKNHVKDVLPLPENQNQEALYLLLNNAGMTRRDFFLDSHILNAPRCVFSLRKIGVRIDCTMISTYNKFGRKIEYGIYSLVDSKEALSQYLRLIKES